jgi:outer membrane protein
MTDLIKQTKTEELQNMQTRLQTFQSSAQKDLQDKEQELLSPIIDKAKKAIQDVAKENKYTYIFDTGTGTILYSEPSDDILPLVKKYLNIE